MELRSAATMLSKLIDERAWRRDAYRSGFKGI
jgi:hypothetical protein